MKKIKIKKLRESCILPKKAHEDDAGYDLYACLNNANQIICNGEFALIPTGFAMELPSGTEAQIRPRSGLAVKHGITVLNSPGTVDFGYSGEIKVCLINHSKQDFLVEDGMRIAQMVICDLPQTLVKEVDFLSETDRGQNGFGSTGR